MSLWRSVRKYWPLIPRLSRSLTVTGNDIDRLPMTSYKCSIVTIALSRTVSEIYAMFAKFSNPLLLTSTAEGFLEFCNNSRAARNWKTKMTPWPERQNNVTICRFVLSDTVCLSVNCRYCHSTGRYCHSTGNWQTDRRTDRGQIDNGKSRALHALNAERDKMLPSSEYLWKFER